MLTPSIGQWAAVGHIRHIIHIYTYFISYSLASLLPYAGREAQPGCHKDAAQLMLTKSVRSRNKVDDGEHSLYSCSHCPFTNESTGQN